MSEPAPEQSSRAQIDAMLIASGWLVQNYKALNLGAGRGIAVLQVPLKSGRCNYPILIDRVPVCVAEAKKKRTRLSAVQYESSPVERRLSVIDELQAVVAASANPSCTRLSTGNSYEN